MNSYKNVFIVLLISVIVTSCGNPGTFQQVMPNMPLNASGINIPAPTVPESNVEPLDVNNPSAYSLIKVLPGFSDRFPVQEVTGVLMAKKMPVTLYPVTNDFFYKYEKIITVFGMRKKVPEQVQKIELSGVEVGFKNLYLAPDPDKPGSFLRYTILYHTTGLHVLSVGIYDRGYLNGTQYIPTESYYQQVEVPQAEHTVIGAYYPNKIINDLEGARRIMQYQLVNGPFVAGQEYSLLKILDFDRRQGYVNGRTSSGRIVTGGGIFIVVTNFNKVLVQMGAQTPGMQQHPSESKYFENPFGGRELSVGISDATIDSKNDFRWIQPTTGYFVFSADVLPVGELLKDPFGSDGLYHDAIEIISMKSVANNGELQKSYDNLVSVRSAYESYRDSKTTSTQSITINGSRPTSLIEWNEGDAQSQLINMIAPEEKVDNFAVELQTDPFLMNLMELRTIINSMEPNSKAPLGDYLKNTSWYTKVVSQIGNDPEQLSLLNDALKNLNDNTGQVDYQVLQCSGLVVILGGMDSGFVPAEKIPAKVARHMIPDAIKNGTADIVYVDGYQVLILNNPEDSQVKDMSVTYYNEVGHVFGVIGKKVVDGQTILLVISSNQVGDGRIKIFEVNENNYEVVFGYPAYNKNAIRK